MKKTSILLASTVMILAVIVAIVGVTAAWFGNQYTYNRIVEVSSANPENNAIIVPGSVSSENTGEAAVLTPAKIKPELVLNDWAGVFNYDLIDKAKLLPDANGNVQSECSEYLDSPAVPVTVTFDFIYSGAPANSDNLTSTLTITLKSVTLKNPYSYVDAETKEPVADPEDYAGEVERIEDTTLTNYVEEFAVIMYVTTTDASVMALTSGLGYYETVTETIDDETHTYYKLADALYDSERITDHKTVFSVIPVTHKLNAIVYFVHVDEMTPPELINAQLFLNFEVVFTNSTNADEE